MAQLNEQMSSLKPKWTWILAFLFSISFCSSQMDCNKNYESCKCHPDPLKVELQCPEINSGSGRHVIRIGEYSVSIDCDELYPESFNTDLLPSNMTVGENFTLQINFCPLPQKNFKSILDKFSIKNIATLKFESFNKNGVTLNKTYFEGLNSLKVLILDSINITYLDEDTFVNTPNLIYISLTRTKVKLKSNTFNPTPLLRSLYISQNHLENLPEDLFRNLANLRVLDLWSNNLTEINELTFSGLSNLESLELAINRIAYISENSFENLTNLKNISLKKNNLTTLPSNLFRFNHNLKKILLNDNFNLILPDYLFSNLQSLEEVNLENCRLQSIPEHIFQNSTNIKTLNLNDNLLKNLPEMLFQGLEQLEELHLQNNKIQNLAHLLAFPKNLKKLHLENNLIEIIGQRDFLNLKKLEHIYLRKNRISQIHYNAFNFENLNTLKIIDLSHNKISEPYNRPGILSYSILDNVVNVMEVDLSHNLITNVDDAINLQNKVSLRKLDLRHNFITSVTIQHFVPLRYHSEVKLDWNNITKVGFFFLSEDSDDKSVYTDISLSNNPIECDCYNYDLFKYFHNEMSPKVKEKFKIAATNLTCEGPFPFENFPVSEFPLSSALCSFEQMGLNDTDDECPEECSCYWRPFDKSLVINCSASNLIVFPNITLPDTKLLQYNQTEINLENNNLIEGPSYNLTGYNNVTKMFLSDNKIKTISWLPPKLQILKLHNNNLKTLNYDILNTLNTSYLVNLTLHNNPWTCDCNNLNFTNFLRQRREIDASHIYCVNSSTLLTSLSRSDLCPAGFYIVYIIPPILLILVISAVLMALYYRYQQEIKVWLYAKNLCLWWVTEEDLDKDKIYDAFISYSHKDEDFVNQNLLPVLEDKEGYKLCLHYRNWVPGEFIAKQVTNSVCDSRRTVVVLSPNFLESVWGKLEFRTAHTQAMTEGRARVIILLYGDVDINSLDNELKSYLKTNTYVKWGDPYFWNKLKYALPHFKKKSPNNQKHANVMDFIDDKFKLVTPNGAPRSTPVLNLDNNLLKQPLSFLPNQGPNQELDTPPAEAGTLLIATSL